MAGILLVFILNMEWIFGQEKISLRFLRLGTSLVVQWVRLHAPNAGGLGSIPGQGTRSCMHAATESPTSCN